MAHDDEACAAGMAVGEAGGAQLGDIRLRLGGGVFGSGHQPCSYFGTGGRRCHCSFSRSDSRQIFDSTHERNPTIG
jgi:hypothetical protein